LQPFHHTAGLLVVAFGVKDDEPRDDVELDRVDDDLRGAPAGDG
jgi:hypothetical protein